MTIQPLHVNRDAFNLPDGSNYNWRGAIDFMAFKRSLDGADMSFLNQRFAAGSHDVVTLLMAHFIEDFNPDNYGDRFFNHIDPFADWMLSLDQYWRPIIFADLQVFGWSIQKQQDFLGRCAEKFNNHWNILPSLGNEFQKNGLDPSRFTRPNTTNLWSRGSSVSDTAPYAPGWDYKEWHPRRDFPNVIWSNNDGWYVKEGRSADNTLIDRPMPCICGETIGFWNQDIPNYRSQDPNLAMCVGGNSIYCLRGGDLMTQEGLRCDVWTPRTEECATRFFRAINQI
jgi:hypothetical protein